MGLFNGVLAVDPWAVINRDIIGTALHGTHQVVLQLWNMYSLVHDEMILYSCMGMNVSKGPTDDTVLFGSK